MVAIVTNHAELNHSCGGRELLKESGGCRNLFLVLTRLIEQRCLMKL
ncbi:hypothetical protein Godav_018273 [Gossypium davidsonii]|uniref:Uncharacterized protein n=3 Tax=Gossypium TaxID=3633 RepID=A0A7J8QVY1_GOSDV|nr:hypothetical protein [Gossypium lobatum]MBA0605731.1 hypothetical protein [Gossypium davidsonii]MBA0640671.1 hypothetical protein [Gossypium klotzschianum]